MEAKDSKRLRVNGLPTIQDPDEKVLLSPPLVQSFPNFDCFFILWHLSAAQDLVAQRFTDSYYASIHARAYASLVPSLYSDAAVISCYCRL